MRSHTKLFAEKIRLTCNDKLIVNETYLSKYKKISREFKYCFQNNFGNITVDYIWGAIIGSVTEPTCSTSALNRFLYFCKNKHLITENYISEGIALRNSVRDMMMGVISEDITARSTIELVRLAYDDNLVLTLDNTELLAVATTHLRIYVDQCRIKKIMHNVIDARVAAPGEYIILKNIEQVTSSQYGAVSVIDSPEEHWLPGTYVLAYTQDKRLVIFRADHQKLCARNVSISGFASSIYKSYEDKTVTLITNVTLVH